MQSEIEKTWSVRMPERFAELYSESEWDSLQLANGSVFAVPWPILTAEQIIEAYDLREDWDIPNSIVPIIGDFHDLIGINYSTERPSVVFLNDARDSLCLFDDFDSFLDGRFLSEEESSDSSGIIEGESWLDI